MFYITAFHIAFEDGVYKLRNLYNTGPFDELPSNLILPGQTESSKVEWAIFGGIRGKMSYSKIYAAGVAGYGQVSLFVNETDFLTIDDLQIFYIKSMDEAFVKSFIKHLDHPSERVLSLYKMLWEV